MDNTCYLVSLCWLSSAVTFSAMNILSNKCFNIRNYASLFHVHLHGIMTNIHSSCGYVLSYVKTDYA